MNGIEPAARRGSGFRSASIEAYGISPPLRIAAAVTAVLAAVKFAHWAARSGLGHSEASPSRAAVDAVVTIAAACGAYWVFVRVVERRAPAELSLARSASHAGLGFAASAAGIAVTFGILWLAGAYRPGSPNPFALALPALFAAAAVATVEEILFRGILFRIAEHGLGTVVAFAMCVALFGLAHIFNPGATLARCAAMALAAGVPFTAAYLLSRRLWLGIGMHAGWNFTERGVFGDGLPPSDGALLGGSLRGPEWLTGGRFGLEASVVLIAVGLGLGAAICLWAVRRGEVVAPVWAREVSEE